MAWRMPVFAWPASAAHCLPRRVGPDTDLRARPRNGEEHHEDRGGDTAALTPVLTAFLTGQAIMNSLTRSARSTIRTSPIQPCIS